MCTDRGGGERPVSPAHHRSQTIRAGSGGVGSVTADHWLYERSPCAEAVVKPENPHQQWRDSGYADPEPRSRWRCPLNASARRCSSCQLPTMVIPAGASPGSCIGCTVLATNSGAFIPYRKARGEHHGYGRVAECEWCSGA